MLPAAGFGAEDGTFTNTERRVQRVRKAITPPGEARPDWEITCQIAGKMGKKGFNFKNSSEIWDEMARPITDFCGNQLRTPRKDRVAVAMP